MSPIKIITATELKENLGKYLDFVSLGNEAVITKNGKNIVRLSPYSSDQNHAHAVQENASAYQHVGKKISYEEFMDIYQNTELRMEFINEKLIILDSPEMYHQDISGNLHVLLRTFFYGNTAKVYYAPFDVHFFKLNSNIPDVMQPDLLVACDARDAESEQGRYMGTPSLCVEIISKSSRPRDLIDKLNTYMLSGVREYWVIDPYKKNVLLYGFKDYAIDDLATYKPGGTLTSYYFNDLLINIDDIFAR